MGRVGRGLVSRFLERNFEKIRIFFQKNKKIVFSFKKCFPKKLLTPYSSHLLSSSASYHDQTASNKRLNRSKLVQNLDPGWR